jgi:hypothetical protein
LDESKDNPRDRERRIWRLPAAADEVRSSVAHADQWAGVASRGTGAGLLLPP